MKYLISVLAAIIMIQVQTFAQALQFEPIGGGKFIYSNNPEGITGEVLANGDNPCYIMNNESLEAGKYYLYLSHFNYTGGEDMGYDVEIDTEITARSDTVITLSNIQFSTNRAMTYTDENGVSHRWENDWGFLDVCAGMLGKPIITRDGSDKYTGIPFEPVTVSLKSGETIWLSQYIENYKTTLFCMPVHMQAELEIFSGSADINVAAFRHNGTLGDRSYFKSEDTAFGIYRRDRCLKGVADSLPQVKSKLSYTIDDETKSGTLLPVTITNQYATEPVETTLWCTNLNPQDDIWSKYITVENDMLPLKYKDDSKLTFYNKNAENKNNVWIFDTRHSDTKHHESSFGINAADYEPNFILDVTKDNQGMGCSMGNYGVTTTYRIEIKNEGNKERWFEYMPKTSSNIIAYISDKDGNFDYAVAKKLSLPASSDYLVKQRLEAGKTTVFYLNVILPVNYNGGVQNSFVINDAPNAPDYEAMEVYEKKLSDGVTYVSEYINQLPDNVPDKLIQNPNSYEIKTNGKIYVARWCAWDGLINYYAAAHDFAKEIFIIDENKFTSKKFSSVPIQLESRNGVFYVKTLDGQIFASGNGKEWWNVNSVPEEKDFLIENISDWAETDISKMISFSVSPDFLVVNDATLPCTRADFCRIVYPLIKGNAEPTLNVFSDTDDIACLTLNGAGIVLGMGDGTFAPEKLISRQEAALILARSAEFFGKNPAGEGFEYADEAEISDWARTAVSAVTELGIMLGMGENKFSPLGEYTVEQAFVTVYRLYEMLNK